jgi:hypothetical protein
VCWIQKWNRIRERYENEYNKGFFVATDAFDNSNIYLLYIYYGEGKE